MERSKDEKAETATFQALDIIEMTSFPFFSLKIFLLLEHHRRLRLVETELHTLEVFLRKVVEKYRKGALSRKKASYLASWAEIQKKVLIATMDAIKEKIQELQSKLSAKERYFIIFELKDVVQKLHETRTLSPQIKKRFRIYEDIIQSSSWAEITNNLPFEELIMSQKEFSRTPSMITQRFEGMLLSSSRDEMKHVSSNADSLLTQQETPTEAIPASDENWDEKIADELMDTFLIDESEPFPESRSMEDLDKELDKLNVNPEVVSKDLEREITLIVEEIKRKRQSDEQKSLPEVQETEMRMDLPLQDTTTSTSENQLNEQQEDEQVDDHYFMYGTSSILGGDVEQVDELNRDFLLEKVEELKRRYLERDVTIRFPSGLQARGKARGFLWIDGTFHSIIQLEGQIRETIILQLLSRNVNVKELELKDKTSHEDLAREMIAKHLKIPKRIAFDQDILWQYSMESYLGLLPWEVKTSQHVIIPLSLLDSKSQSTSSPIITLNPENDTLQWILGHEKLMSRSGGLLGYLLGITIIQEPNNNGGMTTLRILKARKDVREVLSTLRGGIPVSETYMTQFYQRVSRMWNISIEDAKLPIHQARYLLYFFYSGKNKSLATCEQWLHSRFDVTEQPILGLQSGTTPRSLVIIT